MNCDFCCCDLQVDRAHRVHGEPMVVVALADCGSEQIQITMDTPDDWTACDVCFARILRGDLQGIAKDVCAGLGAPDELTPHIMGMLTKL